MNYGDLIIEKCPILQMVNWRVTFRLFTKLAAAYKGFAKQRPPPPICRNEAWEPLGDLAEWRPSRFSGDA